MADERKYHMSASGRVYTWAPGDKDWSEIQHPEGGKLTVSSSGRLYEWKDGYPDWKPYTPGALAGGSGGATPSFEDLQATAGGGTPQPEPVKVTREDRAKDLRKGAATPASIQEMSEDDIIRTLVPGIDPAKVRASAEYRRLGGTGFKGLLWDPQTSQGMSMPGFAHLQALGRPIANVMRGGEQLVDRATTGLTNLFRGKEGAAAADVDLAVRDAIKRTSQLNYEAGPGQRRGTGLAEFAGGFLIPGSAPAKAKGLLNLGQRFAAMGAQGLAQPVETPGDNFWQQKLLQVGTSGAAGVGAQKVLGSDFVQKRAQSLGDTLQALLQKAQGKKQVIPPTAAEAAKIADDMRAAGIEVSLADIITGPNADIQASRDLLLKVSPTFSALVKRQAQQGTKHVMDQSERLYREALDTPWKGLKEIEAAAAGNTPRAAAAQQLLDDLRSNAGGDPAKLNQSLRLNELLTKLKSDRAYDKVHKLAAEQVTKSPNPALQQIYDESTQDFQKLFAQHADNLTPQGQNALVAGETQKAVQGALARPYSTPADQVFDTFQQTLQAGLKELHKLPADQVYPKAKEVIQKALATLGEAPPPEVFARVTGAVRGVMEAADRGLLGNNESVGVAAQDVLRKLQARFANTPTYVFKPVDVNLTNFQNKLGAFADVYNSNAAAPEAIRTRLNNMLAMVTKGMASDPDAYPGIRAQDMSFKGVLDLRRAVKALKRDMFDGRAPTPKEEALFTDLAHALDRDVQQYASRDPRLLKAIKQADEGYVRDMAQFWEADVAKALKASKEGGTHAVFDLLNNADTAKAKKMYEALDPRGKRQAQAAFFANLIPANKPGPAGQLSVDWDKLVVNFDEFMTGNNARSSLGGVLFAAPADKQRLQGVYNIVSRLRNAGEYGTAPEKLQSTLSHTPLGLTMVVAGRVRRVLTIKDLEAFMTDPNMAHLIQAAGARNNAKAVDKAVDALAKIAAGRTARAAGSAAGQPDDTGAVLPEEE